VSTPIRAWKEIFKDKLLDKIVKYTNEYGQAHAKAWKDITRKDLLSFIAILFISGIQKRKDKPSHWFSDNRFFENPVMKKVMSGRKFFTILRYLHCCPVMNQDPTSESYDPTYKVSEMKDFLEERFKTLFIPGQQLSLDETLIRAFGRIKFKVRIVTKAARYGIKIYVVTDAATAYVLRVIIYTGKSTYHQEPDMQQKMKTVQVLERLLEDFTGTHRTVYVDRFYTSVELLKSLAEKNIYVTGTMLANRIPQKLRIAKASRKYKAMRRGDSVKCRLRFRTKAGQQSEAGLVCWRDRNIVYCLSNAQNNFDADECTRRGEGGLVKIPRPASIADYNMFMGGVDVADMLRLQCKSDLMGQNRWWLKLFFYLLDVGTSNALVLYNEGQRKKRHQEGEEYKKMNIVQFKLRLIEAFVGKKLDDMMEGADALEEENVQHIVVHGETRHRCAYCALMSKGARRTRYMCQACGVPLCTLGHGKAGEDCFSLAHETEDRRQLVCMKYLEMQKRDRTKA
jgi:hypothetical protein